MSKMYTTEALGKVQDEVVNLDEKEKRHMDGRYKTGKKT